ncbi:MAG: GIY-YIG nuclease family protein [Allosphingosinicella sp.]|uniref:GIY-YIG nuclease family protein n=1 Tax=Allosphingosinicella sp. TaxID=2823234 RepID=UPI0039412160
MTKADDIRRLAAEGLSVSEVAAKVGVRYQHAYNVLKRGGTTATLRVMKRPTKAKPPLHAQTLLDAGFRRASQWALDDRGLLILTEALPKEVGVYAFVRAGVVMYVGVATMGLAKRIYFYARPGVSQRTSLRLNGIIQRELESDAQIDVLIAQPEDLQWNGLPVHGAAGLELGLIKAYALPWNMRSAK